MNRVLVIDPDRAATRALGLACLERDLGVVIAENVLIENSFVGPFTSVASGCRIASSVLEHCVLLENARIENIDRLEDSLIGKNSAVIKSDNTHHAYRLMLGDDSEVAL